ncbi:hypothetical protein ACFQ07_19895, partial [Actinomadura adrarensis]
PEQSLHLLRRIAGADRIDADPSAAQTLTRHCAQLPLALRIVAERLVSRPYTPAAAFVDELRDEHERLDALGFDDDEMSNVRAVFSSSYRALDDATARVFRLLGLHPGPEFSLQAAAAVTGLDIRGVRRRLDALVDAHLVQLVARDRYRLHDLLRSYAIERADADETTLETDAAVRRVLAWYLHTVNNGHRIVLPNFHAVPLVDPPPTDPLVFDDVDTAMQWFETERGNLLAALDTAMRTRHHDIAWRLPAVMYGFFELRAYWTDWREIHRTGLEAAQLAGDRLGQACNHLGLGDA